MNKYLEDIFFDDIDDLVAHVMERIYDKDEVYSISIVAKFNDAQEIIRAILADEDIRISDIDICSPDFSGYDAEYCLGILADDGVIEFSCAPAISDGYYLDNEADEVYIIENCSSGIFRHCEADEGYLVIVGENHEACDESECVCCECCKEGVEIMCDENGNAHGFTASKTEDDDTVYKSITYYTSNDLTKDEVREILKGYGF